MPVESAADLAVFFNAAEWAKAATYTPPGGGAGAPCTVLIGSEDREVSFGTSHAFAEGDVLQVRRSEIAAPARGGTFLIGATTYAIQGDPRTLDADRAIWTCVVK